MSIQHKNLNNGQWGKLTLTEQLSNVGSEVGRAINWNKKGNAEYSRMAADRALKLIDLTLSDAKNRHRLREISRTREVLVDFLYGQNIYNTTADSLEKYFLAFNYAARL